MNAVERELERLLSENDGVLGLRELELGAKDVELRGEPDFESSLRRPEQLLGSLERVLGDLDETLLADDVEVAGDDVDGEALPRELEVALRASRAPARVLESNWVVRVPKPRSSGWVMPTERFELLRFPSSLPVTSVR